MKIYLVSSFLICYFSLVSCRPQTVQIEQQKLLHLQRALTNDNQVKRGSLEETQRILQEIDRINLNLGYRKKASHAFPRVVSGGNEGYFYPRQQFRPEFLTKARDGNLRMNHRRAIYPFNNQNYFYPAPYLQAPNSGKLHEFKTNKYFYPMMYDAAGSERQEKSLDGSIRLGTIVVLSPEELSDRSPKALSETDKAKDTSSETETIYDELLTYGTDALGLTEEDEEEDDRQETVVSTTRLPSIKNDKYLNLALKKHPQELIDDEDRKLPPSLPSDRAFNFSNPIEKLQNFTKQFTINQNVPVAKDSSPGNQTVSSTPSADDIEDAEDDKADDKEDEKSPFGFAFGPSQQLQTYKEGGLIIQRLKVRRGGIAIAGPGGVATAGSGGTAIVGPNGIALTHPRGLAIGGPGARIYAVPETTDLQNLALTHSARNMNLEGVLVARGPVVYYNQS